MGLRTEYEVTYTAEEVGRLSAYLQCLGLSEEYAEFHAIEALNMASAVMDPGAGVDHSETNLARLMAEFEAWLTWLCENAYEDLHGDPALLAWHLRPVLTQHPEVFLVRENLCEAVRAAVELSARRAVPEEQRVVIPTQPIEAPVFLMGAFWRAAIGRLMNRWMEKEHWSAKERE